jgi:AcrR family transcriptional regulator
VGRPARLTRTTIVETATALVRHGGPGALTMKALGHELGADPSAVYRHVEDKDELLRAVGDRLLDGVVDELPGERSWDEVVRTTCRRLRAALLAQPELAALARDAPTRQPNELRLTETLLTALRAGGFDPAGAAAAYHALIEVTVGAATIDGAVAALPAADRRATYAAWRRAYRRLPRDRYPSSRAAAPFLYRGTADQRFALTVDALLDGLLATVARR